MKLKVIFLLLLAIVAAASSCSAKEPRDKKKTSSIDVTDMIMQKAVGDSIYNIISNAKKVEVTSFPMLSDSIGETISKKVPSKDLQVMKFIATNPKNYLSNKTVYGEFLPQFQAVFSFKKAKVVLKYDFGLRKWGIFDENDKEIVKFDLSSDNMLRFACNMFPANQFFKELLLTRE